MSLFNSEYVYRKPVKYEDDITDVEYYFTEIEVDCKELSRVESEDILLKLVNYPAMVDEDNIFYDEIYDVEDEMAIDKFYIRGEFSDNGIYEIEKVLSRYAVDYYIR